MPLELQIIRAGEFIRAGAQGRLDLAGSRSVLKELVCACRRRDIHRALLDLRDIHPGPTPFLTPDDLASLVNTFHEAGFSHDQRLAVLYAEDPHHGARLFAFISMLRGWNVRAFEDFENALTWLADIEDAAEEVPDASGSDPVRIKTRISIDI